MTIYHSNFENSPEQVLSVTRILLISASNPSRGQPNTPWEFFGKSVCVAIFLLKQFYFDTVYAAQGG